RRDRGDGDLADADQVQQLGAAAGGRGHRHGGVGGGRGAGDTGPGQKVAGGGAGRCRVEPYLPGGPVHGEVDLLRTVAGGGLRDVEDADLVGHGQPVVED